MAVKHDLLLTEICSYCPSVGQSDLSSFRVMQTDASSRVGPLEKLKYKKHFIQLEIVFIN
jgi:hypothetical protein